MIVINSMATNNMTKVVADAAHIMPASANRTSEENSDMPVRNRLAKSAAITNTKMAEARNKCLKNRAKGSSV